MREVSGRFGKILTCEPIAFLPYEINMSSLKDRIEAAGERISKDVRYEEIELLDDELTSIPATDDVKNFSYTVIDNDVYYRENSLFIKKEVSDKNKEKIKDYLKLNEALKDVIKSQKEDFSDEEIKASQDKLNEVYDSFSKKHGFVNNLSNTRALREDSNFPLVSSIEILDEEDVRIGKVCYVALLEDGSLQTTETEISKLLLELKKHIGDVLGKSKNLEDKILEIRQLLSEISYLFKNMSYSHEQEYRILLEYGENEEKERNIEPLISDKGITLHIKLKPVELRYSRAILGPRAVDIDFIAPYLKLCNPEIVIERSKIDFR